MENPVSAFLVGLAVAVGLSFTVVWYLKTYLNGILVDVCGTERRAAFWMAFSNVILILVPVVFGMHFQGEARQDLPIVFQLSYQLKWSFIGLASSVLALGMILTWFIRRSHGGSLAN